MTIITFKAIKRSTVLPGTTKAGQKIKTSITMKELGAALVNGVVYVTNGEYTVGYPLTVDTSLIEKEMVEGSRVWLYLTEDSATVRPIKEEKKMTNGFSMTQEQFDQLMADGQRMFDEIFGDTPSLFDKFGI